MERRKNTIQKNWLRSIAKHLLRNTRIIEDRRKNESNQNNTSIRSVGNYSFAQSDFTEKQ
jgi:hypothetical protein